MNALLGLFLAVRSASGLIGGVIAGRVRLPAAIASEIAALGARRCSPHLALAALWHGPLGGADRFCGKVERERPRRRSSITK